MDRELTTYQGLLTQSQAVGNILTPEMADAVFKCNECTVKNLSPTWMKNLKQNIRLFEKHGSFLDAFRGFGQGKAVICIGAGPSFNKNKHILKTIYDLNSKLPLFAQPFIFVSTNKQLRPLLDLGVYPHFTLLIDAGDVLLPQFKIPKWAQEDCFLVCGLHCSPKITSHWDKQGGRLYFYLIGQDEEKEYFKSKTGKDPEPYAIQQGGNVMNTMWILSHRVLGSSTFIMVGNDLCYKYSKSKEDRQDSFYADGDYRLNILNKRDEAKDNLAWMGIKDIYKSYICDSKTLYDLSVYATSRQLWVYKTWLEVQAAVWSEQKSFFIMNASESGISGVLARSYKTEDLKQKSNWFLIDEILPKRWLTTTLENACERVLEAKKCLKEIKTDAGLVMPWAVKTDTASTIDLRA